MTKEQKPNTMRTALIGLIGTFLTVCGGITGALVTNAAAIYQLEAEHKKVEIKSSDGSEILDVNAGETYITRQEAAELNPTEYYVDLEQSFVLHRPLEGWSEIEEMTVGEQLAEAGVTCIAVCDQPVYRIRHGEAILVESDRSSTVDGEPIAESALDISEALYGPPPWTLPNYNELILNIFEKEAVQPLRVETLADIIIRMTGNSSKQVYKLAAPEGEHFALVQSSSTYGGIRINGQDAQMTMNNWMFFAETEDAFYMVEIRYTPEGGDPLQTWDDLQYYVDQFRVIEEQE